MFELSGGSPREGARSEERAQQRLAAGGAAPPTRRFVELKIYRRLSAESRARRRSSTNHLGGRPRRGASRRGSWASSWRITASTDSANRAQPQRLQRSCRQSATRCVGPPPEGSHVPEGGKGVRSASIEPG